MHVPDPAAGQNMLHFALLRFAMIPIPLWNRRYGHAAGFLLQSPETCSYSYSPSPSAEHARGAAAASWSEVWSMPLHQAVSQMTFRKRGQLFCPHHSPFG